MPHRLTAPVAAGSSPILDQLCGKESDRHSGRHNTVSRVTAMGLPIDQLYGLEPAGAHAVESYFDPSKTRAGIVTCGGLCPGLNNVIRSWYWS